MHMNARDLNFLLGIWLFFSAFLWPLAHAQMVNTWILGVLCVVFSILGMVHTGTRHLNTVVGFWVFVSAWALPWDRLATVWNNVIVGIAIFVVSLLPGVLATPPWLDPHAGR